MIYDETVKTYVIVKYTCHHVWIIARFVIVTRVGILGLALLLAFLLAFSRALLSTLPWPLVSTPARIGRGPVRCCAIVASRG